MINHDQRRFGSSILDLVDRDSGCVLVLGKYLSNGSIHPWYPNVHIETSHEQAREEIPRNCGSHNALALGSGGDEVLARRLLFANNILWILLVASNRLKFQAPHG